MTGRHLCELAGISGSSGAASLTFGGRLLAGEWAAESPSRDGSDDGCITGFLRGGGRHKRSGGAGGPTASVRRSIREMTGVGRGYLQSAGADAAATSAANPPAPDTGGNEPPGSPGGSGSGTGDSDTGSLDGGVPGGALIARLYSAGNLSRRRACASASSSSASALSKIRFTARESDNGWSAPPFFEYPFANFGIMFPRSITVLKVMVEDLPLVLPSTLDGVTAINRFRGAVLSRSD